MKETSQMYGVGCRFLLHMQLKKNPQANWISKNLVSMWKNVNTSKEKICSADNRAISHLQKLESERIN